MSGDDERPVDPGLYTEEYYLEACGGADLFASSGGTALPPLLETFLDEGGIGDATRVLDIGAGRGEVVLRAARAGAVAVGIDYADAALRLSKAVLDQHHETPGSASVCKADAKVLPFGTATFDVAVMLDIVEHLRPWELDQALREVRRVLRPGGRLLVHTMPNLWFYRWVYPVLFVVSRLQGVHAPRDPRGTYEHEMHVYEQTPRTVRRHLEAAGFDPEVRVVGFEKSPVRAGFLAKLSRGLVTRTPLQRALGFHVLAVGIARPT